MRDEPLRRSDRLRILKPLVFLAALLPSLRLLQQTWQSVRGTGDGLGANPIEALTHATGDWTIYFLLITLSVTPLRRITGWNVLGKLRRMLGLYAFFYGSLHLATYLFDQLYVQADVPGLRAVLQDVLKRPYITAGTLAYALMVPLAITSTAAMVRRLGRRWQTLHRLTYVCALLGVLHFAWLVKGNPLVRLPGLLGAGLLGLLLFRLITARSKRSP